MVKCIVWQKSNTNSKHSIARQKICVANIACCTLNHIQWAFVMLYNCVECSSSIFFLFILLHMPFHTTAELRVKCVLSFSFYLRFTFFFLLAPMRLSSVSFFLFQYKEQKMCAVKRQVILKKNNQTLEFQNKLRGKTDSIWQLIWK